MTTGIIAALGNSASVTYNPLSNAKVRVDWAAASTNLSLTWKGTTVAVATGAATNLSNHIEFYIAAGDSVAIATGASMTAIVSTIEEGS